MRNSLGPRPNPKTSPVVTRNASMSRAFGGRVDGAQRFHAETLRIPCDNCGAFSTASLKAFVYVKDLPAHPHIAAGLARGYPDGQVPVARFKDGDAVRIATHHACPRCLPSVEKAFAKHPDYVFVDIDRGPSASKASISLA